MKYLEKVYHFQRLIEAIEDSRPKPQIETPVVVGGALIMALARMCSLNVLEGTKENPFLETLAGTKLTQCRYYSRVFTQIDCDTIREALHRVYSRLKRNKALTPSFGGLFALIVEGL